jgi:hypothetical protein
MENSDVDFLSVRFLLTSLMDQHMVRISLYIFGTLRTIWGGEYLNAVESKK